MQVFGSEGNSIPIDPESFGNLVLKGFHEITLPDTVSYLPVTLGWQLLALVALAYGLYRLYCGLCTWRKNHYRRVAVAKLGQIMQQNLPAEKTIQYLTTLLKAAALQAYPREEVAPLTGAEWFEFLNQQTDENSFDNTAEAIFQAVQYGSDLGKLNHQSCVQFAQQIERWLLKHRPIVIGLANA